MLNAYQNQGTIKGLLDPETGIMSIDTNNRLAAVSDRRNAIRGNKSSGQTTTSASTENQPFSVGGTYNGHKILAVKRLK